MDGNDAFSRILETKRRPQSRQSINRFSRVFEPSHLDKPTPPSKPPLLREQIIDEVPLTFKDIRAKFQNESSIPIQPKTHYRPPIPLKPSKTGPALPEKVIIPARTGPPTLPTKPKLRNEMPEQPRSRPDTSLYMPNVIPRTETGNSSIVSTSSTSSSQYSNKKGWHSSMISSWFSSSSSNNNTPQQQQEALKNSIRRQPTTETVDSFGTVSPQVTGSKRKKVMTELLETERAYQKDMSLLKEIYYDQAVECLSRSDVRHLFSNLLDIVEFEKSFVVLLEHSYEQDTIGTAFRESMRTIDSIYSDYCKRHEDAVLRLQELETQAEAQAFLNKCQEQLQGKTTSWDLGSLLIKPVQRVLKYPLLLREILTLTSPTHLDHDDLASALKEIEEVAENINEIKRRKDIVEKIVGDKKKTDINVVHGINKKFTRRAQRLKQATGFAVEPTHDILFEALHTKFEEQQENIRQLARDVQGWVRHIKIMFENLHQLACNFDTFYSSWGGVRVKSMSNIQEFSKMASHLSVSLSRELDNDVRGFVYSRIDEFLKVFENPAQVIHKRSLKMIDYDRVRDMKSKGDIPDKALQESADAYVSINAQLVEELPKFFELTAKYFDILVGGLAHVQTKFYKLMQREWTKLVEQHLGEKAASGYAEIITKYMQQYERLQVIADQIDILHPDRYVTRTESSSSFDQRSLRSLHSLNSTASSKVYTSQPSFTSQENLPHDFECVVLYDYQPYEKDKLNVKRGDILVVHQDEDHMDPDWWYGTLKDSDSSGWVPINYCQRL
ncbi:uncharacterized protein RHIMIDRAFT_253498 [Rhizopus microsporus ATCC 52813]|uniref:Dynamin-binding protein n=1 Tax=Rhizopus microsporus ATCC 52813 TaxID=1340429 RepID=A0A2G4T8A1_RHIZD|nr:uncharacterized protein RHIMIDRAFT_253498 [Rhizopus microsporus ATCC 52813]PHZ17252.1 hypothetical protein RHIMIDRAFT_253498 [Rhizopus microsporus ATCC 52813]